ncbi:MAG TPA: ABC transporter ATP-binding protein [Mycobacteriales bacterium]|nr:ABC transporter ATP-binding protein [Mycobacteriales bacterium]
MIDPLARTTSAVGLVRVTRLFDGLAAVSQISLELALGETVWLRGSNGSGKSTLLRLVATAISPTYGGGTVLGHDLTRGRAAIRAETDLVGHQTRLYDDLTAAENLRFAADLHGLDPGGIPAALDRVGLQEVATVRAASFSQGMRQRLVLARCLLRAPRLILLDEPYAGLDPDARTVVDDLLAGARGAGRTIVIASHDPPPPRFVDRTLLMDGGRLSGGPP